MNQSGEIGLTSPDHSTTCCMNLREKNPEVFQVEAHVTVHIFKFRIACMCVCVRARQEGSNCCRMATLLLCNDMSVLKWRLGQSVCVCVCSVGLY